MRAEPRAVSQPRHVRSHAMCAARGFAATRCTRRSGCTPSGARGINPPCCSQTSTRCVSEPARARACSFLMDASVSPIAMICHSRQRSLLCSFVRKSVLQNSLTDEGG
eukprot:7391167-Prymnesium_polylepis.1